MGHEEGPEIGGGYSRRREQADKRTAFAAKLRKAAGGDDTAEAAPEGETATAVADPEGEVVEAEAVEMTEQEIAQAEAEGAQIVEVEEVVEAPAEADSAEVKDAESTDEAPDAEAKKDE